MKIDIITENSLIIPEYIIDIKNKSKKTIELVEHYEKLKNLEQQKSKDKNSDTRGKKKFIKKKNYKKKIDKKFLENSIAEAKDLVSEAYLENKIMHIIIETFLVKKKYYQTFEENLYGDQLSLEISFLMIPNSFISKVESVVEKYQIKISGCLNKNYITNFFNKNNLELSEKAYKIQLGCNVNEVQIVPKNYEKKGFFEKFFQFFS